MADYNIQMHNYNGSSYDNLYPKTKSTVVIMADGKTVEEAITAAGGGSLLTITFESAFAGKSFTVSGGGFSYTGTVPSSSPYTASCSLPYTSTTYTISSVISSVTYSTTVETGEYYGSVAATLARATITVTFGSDFSGKSYTVTHSGSTYESGTVPSGLQVVIGVAPNSGSYTISGNNGSGTYSTTVNAPTTTGGNTDATVVSVDSTLNNNSFATIRQVSDAGTGATYWSVGDRKAVTFTSGAIGNGTETKTISGTWYMSVLGFNHNNEGGIHFQFGWTALTGGVQIAFTSWTADQAYGAGSGNGLVMNSSNTNVGGWPNSLMRGTELGQNKSNPSSGSFMYLLPSDLRNVMRSVIKTTNTGNSGGSNTETSTDYLWLPSEVEVFGSASNSGTTTGQAQYDYYKGVSAGSASKNAFTAAGKVRYGHDKTSRAVYWWERSPSSSNANHFCRVNYNGLADISNAYASYGIAPCLCI